MRPLAIYLKYLYFSSLNEMILFVIVYVKLIFGFGIAHVNSNAYQVHTNNIMLQ